MIPDIWIEQGPQKDQYDIAGLNEVHIAAKIEKEINSLREYKPKSVMDVKGDMELANTGVGAGSYFQSIDSKPSGPSYDTAWIIDQCRCSG